MPEIDPSSMSYRELQKACKALGLPAQGKKEVLLQWLIDYKNDPEGTKERVRREAKKSKKKRGAWVDWKNHAAREILLEDVEPNGWLHGEDKDARLVYDIYKERQEEFKEVPFDQFEVRYNEAIKKAAKRRARSAQEAAWMRHDRRLYPRQTHNHRGEKVFDMDDRAKRQLRKDIKNKLHKQMTPMELWLKRKRYHRHYKLSKFRHRIYQEIRRVKFNNFLEKKRTEKRKEFAARKAEAADITFVRN